VKLVRHWSLTATCEKLHSPVPPLLQFPDGNGPGGYKQSGFGREFARDILDAYTITKSVVINLEEGEVGSSADTYTVLQHL